jgi:4-alpha-glucanotransferase
VRPGRVSGILLHPTSLPGREPIGTLGAEAREFAAFLADAGQRVWQVLPLGPTGYGDSPYQCFSAFAGNHLLIDVPALIDEGLLAERDLTDETKDVGPPEQVDYGQAIAAKQPLLRRAAERFEQTAHSAERGALDTFVLTNAAWLEDFALFMAIKAAHGGVAWTRWPSDIATREPSALELWRRRLDADVRMWRFAQYVFHKQWAALRQHCHALGIQLMGDVPIFVAHDSADVWAHPELFRLEADGWPAVVAGVPPDYFSETGQLWGNPIYRWDVLAADGYRWWIERFRATLALVDIVRLDHFRGFEAYWEIPASARTAVTGRWVKGPGAALFEALRSALGDLPVVAENLGVITPEVEALRTQFGFPGMAILQFAFGTDPQAPYFKPHNYTRDRVVFTGTHDNDTTAGWWTGSDAGHSTRTLEEIERERDHARRYLRTDGTEIHWAFIHAVMASVADVAMIPMQDVLGLGSRARMNAPGRPTGNWRWRMRADMLAAAPRDRLRELSVLYERFPG